MIGCNGILGSCRIPRILHIFLSAGPEGSRISDRQSSSVRRFPLRTVFGTAFPLLHSIDNSSDSHSVRGGRPLFPGGNRMPHPSDGIWSGTEAFWPDRGYPHSHWTEFGSAPGRLRPGEISCQSCECYAQPGQRFRRR